MTFSTLLHEHDIPAPPYITLLGDEQKMMNVRDARLALDRHRNALPSDWLELSNLASAHYVLGDVSRAAELSSLALSKNRNVSTLMNAAVILETHGRFAEALPLAAEANSLDPGDPYAGVLYSAALLRFGRWLEAWPDYVKYCANFSWLRPVISEWGGLSESLVNKRLLVLDEGGYGDNIFFFRWMPQLKALGAHVTLKCPTQFGPLVSNYPFIDRVIGGGLDGAAVEIIPREYDLFTSILDLGLHFSVACHEYRWTGPYMFADAHKASQQRQTLRGDALTIGLCWKSGENVSPRKHRSLTPEQTERILRTSPPAGCNWVSLVYDELPPISTPGVSVRVPTINDWSDTAAVLAALDLLVTTDTGVAHLAGAMGIPVWVLLPGISAWQFLLNCERHPLYPSMRMFRNRGEGIDNAVDALSDVLARGVR